MDGERHVGVMVERKGAHRVLVGKSEGQENTLEI